MYNEESIKNYNISQPHIVISIQNPAYDFVKLPKLNSRKAWLGQKFHDVDDIYIYNFNNWCKERNLIPFTSYHAKSVLKFVNEWKDKIDIICVNCVAGVSRSAGIAGALSKILNGDDFYFFKHYIPNRYVYKIILREYYGQEFNDFTEQQIEKIDKDINFF
ncbi:MAG: hypothetical protein PVG65_00100 [Candidatus Thorarchaeota archaeon]